MCPESKSKRPLYSSEVIDELRQLDLEEVAIWLGMERDCHDKKKWRISGCTISIDPERGVFFDC